MLRTAPYSRMQRQSNELGFVRSASIELHFHPNPRWNLVRSSVGLSISKTCHLGTTETVSTMVVVYWQNASLGSSIMSTYVELAVDNFKACTSERKIVRVLPTYELISVSLGCVTECHDWTCRNFKIGGLSSRSKVKQSNIQEFVLSACRVVLDGRCRLSTSPSLLIVRGVGTFLLTIRAAVSNKTVEDQGRADEQGSIP
jgi:hypothetical protein